MQQVRRLLEGVSERGSDGVMERGRERGRAGATTAGGESTLHLVSEGVSEGVRK